MFAPPPECFLGATGLLPQEQELEAEGDVKKVAKHIAKWTRRASSSEAISSLMSAMTISYKQAISWLEAVAECSASAQRNTLHEVLRYVSAMKNAGAVQPLMLAIRNSYDENTTTMQGGV